jgi:hypothetical protein
MKMPQGGDRKSCGKYLRNDLGSLPSRSRGFAGFAHPMGVAGSNVRVLPNQRDDPKGLQSKYKEPIGVVIRGVFLKI